jgi:uncharacterized protein YgiM (DUF1202 family)
MRPWQAVSAALLLALGVVQAASNPSAQIIVNSNLGDGPHSDAHTVAAVPVNTGVTVIGRQGGWYHVRLDSGTEGWLPMTSLRLSNSGSVAAAPANAGLTTLFNSGRSGATGSTASTGVRGLNSGDIQNAQPNPQAVIAINAWAAKPEDARQYAGVIPLRDQKVDYLPKADPQP